MQTNHWKELIGAFEGTMLDVDYRLNDKGRIVPCLGDVEFRSLEARRVASRDDLLTVSTEAGNTRFRTSEAWKIQVDELKEACVWLASVDLGERWGIPVAVCRALGQRVLTQDNWQFPAEQEIVFVTRSFAAASEEVGAPPSGASVYVREEEYA